MKLKSLVNLNAYAQKNSRNFNFEIGDQIKKKGKHHIWMPMRERFRENFHLKFEIGDQIKKVEQNLVKSLIDEHARLVHIYVLSKHARPLGTSE